MTERGGSATQAGIFYQNTVAALALADLLDLGYLVPRERLLDVRVEAPEHVDDIVLRYADGHQDFQSAKLSLQVGSKAWCRLWESLWAQSLSSDFGPMDQISIVVAERNAASSAVAQMCDLAGSSIDLAEFTRRLGERQLKAHASVVGLVSGEHRAFELLRTARLLHQTEDAIDKEFGRRRLTGGPKMLPSMLPILRDIVGGASRRRGLFRPAALRRRLQHEHGLVLGEPPEWGLAAFRSATKQMARLTIPGTQISGPTGKMFVWPRARTFDASTRVDFENEQLSNTVEIEDPGIDLRTFPNDQFDRVVVVAGPGHGKSALLTALADRIVDGPLVPVSVPLASLAAADTSISQFLHTTMSQELEVSANWELLAEQGLLVLLLDGLDEVPAASRPPLMKRISLFSARYPQSPWILTVRDAAVLGDLPQATIVELLQLDDNDIEKFATTMPERLGGLQPWGVVQRLKSYPDLDRLARIPLFLMMLLATIDLNDPKPLTRSDLIETYLTTLFSPERFKTTASAKDQGVMLRAIAETLAFEQLERQEVGATEREVRDVVSRLFPDTGETETLLERMRTNGILKPQSLIRLQFPYPIVQEYLAARHLVDKYPERLHLRIEDAVQRPWAQVIQFAIELSPDPEPVIEAMLLREDDAFATGLRLVGRCVANGARVGESLRLKVGERLVDFWVHAPTVSRQRVGRVLTDGFWDMASPKLDTALHHYWLLRGGAGDILSRRKDTELTLEVLQEIIQSDRDSLGFYHEFKNAMRAAGDEALQLVLGAMDPEAKDAKAIERTATLLWNFDIQSVSRELVLTAARNDRLPVKARLRAYGLAGPPLEDAGAILLSESLMAVEGEGSYSASDLISIHEDPPAFLGHILRLSSIAVERRAEIASDIALCIKDGIARRGFALSAVSDISLDVDVRTALRLFESRWGDAKQFRSLVAEIPTLPIKRVATTIALFGHHPDKALAEEAAALTRTRLREPGEIVSVAGSIVTGLRNVFEMDWGFGGVIRPAPPHAGIASWIELVEDWSDRPDLGILDKLQVEAAGAGLGSASLTAALERSLLAIDDFDNETLVENDTLGNIISSALYQLRRRATAFPDVFVERLLRSSRYNIASRGVGILADRGDETALNRLVAFNASNPDWHLRDLAANKIETVAARLHVAVRRVGTSYLLDGA